MYVCTIPDHTFKVFAKDKLNSSLGTLSVYRFIVFAVNATEKWRAREKNVCEIPFDNS